MCTEYRASSETAVLSEKGRIAQYRTIPGTHKESHKLNWN
jgi:hypothetical protein